MSPNPKVDVIIPVHDPSRPLGRTLRSLTHTGLDLGREVLITVVCHNISAEEIRSALPVELTKPVNFLEFYDGLPSPAGPRTHALLNTNGQYVSFLDSDDTFEPGALDDWVARAEKHSLDAVIPPERHDAGKKIRTPVVRPFRRGNLHPVGDRMSYRTAPLGLIRRTTIVRLDLTFGRDVRNGSDQIFALKLWFGETRIRFARGGPGYIVGADAKTRVTTQLQPLAAELKATRDLFESEWFAGLSTPARRAIAVKFVRLQLFGGIARRLETNSWTPEAERDARLFLQLLDKVAPGYVRSLSIADVRLCDALAKSSQASTDLRRLARKRQAFGHPTTMLTRDIRALLLPDAPIRYMVASALH
ncbi:MAG: glycosyltransferase family A protein [Homoserinimonas sp.]